MPEIESCLIEPRRGRSDQPLPPSAIIVFSPEDLSYFLQCFSRPVSRPHRIYLSDIYTGEVGNTSVAIAGPMLGAPQTILVLERMIACGVRKVIAAGWCGSLLKNVRIGDIVLPTSAIPEEGTSAHYSLESLAPSGEMILSLRESLEDSGMSIHEGAVWSTDAPFRETFSKVRRFQSSGVLAVDMETSALFAVSKFRQIELAVILVVSDDLSGLKWVHGFRDPAFKQAREKVVRSTIDAICSAAESLGRD